MAPVSVVLRAFDGVRVGPAQILLRWALHQNIAVIPKSNSHKRLVDNLACDKFDLTEDEEKAISRLNINLRVSAL